MANRYNSFVLRCWQLGADMLRIKIEHVQSGEQIHVTVPQEAFAWLAAHWGQSAGQKGPDSEAPLAALP